MSLRKFCIGILAFSVLLLASAVSFGQIGKIAGKVYKLDADGKPQPVAGAKITCYRTDTEQTCKTATTDSKGTFLILGVPIGGRFILGVSGPGLEPTFFPETKCGVASEDIQVSVNDGEGTEPTEEQVRTSAAATITGDLTEEQKKAQAELEKKRLEILEKNKRIEENNARRVRLGQEGTDAYNNKDYETAIAKYDEGYKVDPEFVGSAPQFLNNLAVSYKQRGVTKYLEAAATKDTAKINAGRKNLASDMFASLTAAMESRRILVNAKPADIQNPESHKSFGTQNDSIIKDDFSILAQVNLNLLSYEDPDEKRAAALKLYRDGYEAQPSNPDVIAGLSLALYLEASIADDKALKQESLNFGTKFLKTAKADHKLREALQPIMDLIISDDKLKPQPMN